MKKESNSNYERFVVNLSPSAKLIFISLFFIDAVCIFLLIYFFLFPDDTTFLEKIIFVPLICLMLVILIICGIIIRTRIVVDGDEFIYYPPLRRKQIYSFSQITKITLKVQIGHCFYTVCTDKKLLSMSQQTKNHQLFIEKCIQHNIPIENIPKKQHKK